MTIGYGAASTHGPDDTGDEVEKDLRGALMVCGTASDVGKSVLVAGLCRALARRGIAVAPFKAQNMSNNAAVARDGAEIGRAQYAQALAAGADPEAAMNPVLLKPTSETTSQVVVMGTPAGTTDATDWGARAPDLLPVVVEALDTLRRRFDVVVLEGAGGAAEVNLLDRDIVNLRLAHAAGVPAVVVADIDRGGAFAALFGTWALLPDHLRSCIRGFVLNRFRGDPALLAPAVADLETRTGVPVVGVVPWSPLASVDEEDSLALTALGRSAPQPPAPGPGEARGLDVAVVRFPRISNFTDLDPLLAEPDVRVRLVDHPRALGRPDLAVLPGTKHTVGDLAWLRETGLADAVWECGAEILALCGGYQMAGRRIVDDVESKAGAVDGLAWLPVETVFAPEKTVRWRSGRALGHPVEGYEIRHGEPTSAAGWIELDDASGRHTEGARSDDGRVWGTSLHGLFESDAFRRSFLTALAARRGVTFVPSAEAFGAVRERRFDALADLVETHLGVDQMVALASTAGRPARVGRP